MTINSWWREGFFARGRTAAKAAAAAAATTVISSENFSKGLTAQNTLEKIEILYYIILCRKFGFSFRKASEKIFNNLPQEVEEETFLIENCDFVIALGEKKIFFLSPQMADMLEN